MRESVDVGSTRWHGFWLAIGMAVTLLAVPGVSVAGRAIPMVFEANHGQTDPGVKFLSRGPGFTLFVTESETVMADRRTGQVVRLRLRGARQMIPVVGLEPLPGRSHYYRGRNPANWLTNVPTYGRVAYRDAYPGIDARYRAGPGSRLEQEFVVRPGADAAAIGLQFDGVRTVTVDAAGDLVLTTPTAPVRLSRPIAYQEIDGTRRVIPAAWVVRGPRDAGFELGAYDRAHQLVIDPVVAWATRLAARGDDQAFGVAADVGGNVYVTGDTTSANFPTVGGSTLAGGFDAFVTKLDANGQFILYSAYIGGSGTDGGRAIAVDSSFNAYLTGFTDSADFPVTSGAFQQSPQGDFDAFVVKLNATGMIAYSTRIGGSSTDIALGIAVDGSGRAHVAGGTRSRNFPVFNALQPLPGGSALCDPPSFECRDAFVARVSALGNILEYSTFLGGSGEDAANAIALDGSGNAYVTGFALSADFPTTPGSLNPGPALGMEAFVARVNADASLGWATFLGGNLPPGDGTDIGNGIAVTSGGSPHIVGSTTSTNFPSTGGDIFTGLTDGFATRLDTTGSRIVWSRSTGPAIPTAVALDSINDVHLVANQAVCTDPSLTLPGCLQVHLDVVVNKRSGVTGDTLDIIRFGGTPRDGSGDDFGHAITAFRGNIWVVGHTFATDFPTTSGTVGTAPQGLSDAFVVKLVELAAPVPPSSGGGGDEGGGDHSCVIATAAFGSPLAGEVQTLRRFRDRALLTNAAGRLFVRAYYQTSPPFARVVAREPVLAAGVRGLLRPVAVGAGFALDRPFVAVAVAGFALVGIAGLWVRKRRALACLIIAVTLLGGALVLGVLEQKLPSGESPGSPPLPPAASRAASPEPRALDGRVAKSHTSTPSSQTWDRPLVRGPVSVTLLNPLAPPSVRRWAVSSDLIEGTLGADGFVVTNPRHARGLGLQAGDTIVSIDAHPPTGLLAVVLLLQRDPDRSTVVVEIDRGGTRLVQSHRVR
ncbi:MAG: SBBP repeat-containing protein [Candidatus Rokuibacteriota bacterium]